MKQATAYRILALVSGVFLVWTLDLLATTVGL